MSEGPRNFQAALRRLRQEYREELPARLDSLEAQLARARADGTAEALRDARQRAHTLKGTSGSYGMAGVSQALEAVEDALDRLLDDPGPASRAWGQVAAAVERARLELRR